MSIDKRTVPGAVVLVLVVIAASCFVLFSPAPVTDTGCERDGDKYICDDPSMILHIRGYDKVTIEDSTLMGVYAYDNSEVVIRKSRIYRSANYDNAMMRIENTQLNYLNDNFPEIENIIKGIIGDDMTDEEKVLAVHKWANNSIVHDECPTYGLPNVQNYNVSLVLNYMDGDCGAHSAVLGALAHYMGYPSRFIQAKGHVVNEVYFDGKWHMIDSDPSSNNGKYYRGSDGSILSCMELFEDPGLYDRDFLHTWQDKYKRYYDIGYGQLSIDKFQTFPWTLKKDNKEEFKTDLYDNGWLYLPPVVKI